MIVVDASAVVDLLLRTPRGERVRDRLSEEDLHAPELLDVEVLQAIRRLLAARVLDEGRAAEAIVILIALPIDRHSHRNLVERTWMMRASVSAYDAMYVALAEGLGATLVTCDARLAHSPGLQAKIDLISDT